MSEDLKPYIPVVSFDTIHADYMAKGVDLYDANRMLNQTAGKGHFASWCESKNIPENEEDPVVAKQNYQLYKDDTEGEAAAPLYVNVWHYLFDVSEVVPWNEAENERTKSVVIAEAILTVKPSPSNKDHELIKSKLEMAGPVPDGIIEYIQKQRIYVQKQSAKAREIMLEILEKYGKDIPEYGKVMMIGMKVDR